MATRTFEYGPYELVCTATPLPSGGYAATVVVALGHESAREETPVPLDDAPPFGSEDAAIEHAAANGREWVDNFG